VETIRLALILGVTYMRLLSVSYEPEVPDYTMKSDADAEKYVTDIVEEAAKGNYTVLLTNQEIMIDCVRLCILEGKIPHKEVEFRFGDKIIFPDKYGHLDWWPVGFCDYRDNITNRLLNGMFDKFKGAVNDSN
jgi:hypothetical protein